MRYFCNLLLAVFGVTLGSVAGQELNETGSVTWNSFYEWARVWGITPDNAFFVAPFLLIILVLLGARRR